MRALGVMGDGLWGMGWTRRRSSVCPVRWCWFAFLSYPLPFTHYPLRSTRSRLQQIVHVERPEHAVVRVHDEEAVDLERAHELHGLGGEPVGLRGLGIARHDLGDLGGVDIDAVVEHPAQIAVGEDAGQPPVPVEHAGHPEALAGHLEQHLTPAWGPPAPRG